MSLTPFHSAAISRFPIFRSPYAGGRTDFTKGNLKAQICSIRHTFYPAEFKVSIYLFLCFQLSGFVCVSLSSKIPSRIFSSRVGCVSCSVQRAGFWRYSPARKSPQALCTSKAILDFHFLEITSLLGVLNCNRQYRQDRACIVELADLGLNFPLVKSILPPASLFSKKK